MLTESEMVLRYLEARIRVAASGSGVTIKTVRPPLAVLFMSSELSQPLTLESGERRQAGQADPHHVPPGPRTPGVGSPLWKEDPWWY